MAVPMAFLAGLIDRSGSCRRFKEAAFKISEYPDRATKINLNTPRLLILFGPMILLRNYRYRSNITEIEAYLYFFGMYSTLSS
jgi:hypothetical protein